MNKTKSCSLAVSENILFYFLRAQAMREPRRRQLFFTRWIPSAPLGGVAFLAAGLLLVSAAHSADESANRVKAQQELAAVQLFEIAVLNQISADKKEKEAAANDHEKVVRAYEELIQRYPNHAPARNAYAQFLWLIGRREPAFAQWTRAYQIDPSDAATASALGGYYLAAGEVPQALDFFQKAVALEPRNPLFHYQLGNAAFLFRHELEKSGDPKTPAALEFALEHLRVASELAPFNEDLARGYAETFYALPNPAWEQALAAWERYLELTTNKQFAYSHIARVQIKLGRLEQARETMMKFEGPGAEKTRQIIQKQLDRASPVPERSN
jgi:tetratricopeptide (TPR) repeat protein